MLRRQTWRVYKAWMPDDGLLCDMQPVIDYKHNEIQYKYKYKYKYQMSSKKMTMNTMTTMAAMPNSHMYLRCPFCCSLLASSR